MTEGITTDQAVKKLVKISEEWVEKDLEKGIALPFSHWRGGRRKELISLIFWRSVIVPVLFGMTVIVSALAANWKLFTVLFICYIIYWLVCALLCRRERGNFILKTDGITIITSRKKLFIPWEAIKNVVSAYGETVFSLEQVGHRRYKTNYANSYHLVIQVANKTYTFYEVYAKALVKDTTGRINPAMMPLHVIYIMLKTAKHKVNK